ncbi:hypothetical protein [uncultured Pseudomonas sp.]|uniref:hypothetical protein n=1 Tax=uncultured Pseudomonas sp. TaxID=114707 RepID=UPI0025DC97B3|nr:hypothetical protein [uncultured Pseudomonas sp.]
MLRKLLPLGILSVFFVGCDSGMQNIHKSIKAQLVDPESAQFKNEIRNEWGIVCGEVNAKNNMGGYAGFRSYRAFEVKNTGWQVKINEEKNDVAQLILCNSSPAEIRQDAILTEKGAKAWYAKIPGEKAISAPAPSDVERISKLGYKILISEGSGQAYIGPFKNKFMAEVVSESVFSQTGVFLHESEWIF